MRVKKIKRICGVRGCKNTHNVYALSQRTEMGNSVIMCEDCMKEALKTIAKQTKPELEVTLSSVADVVPKPQEVIEAKTEELTELVAEDTVTIEEDTTKAPAPKPRATTNTKKKTNKKK